MDQKLLLGAAGVILFAGLSLLAITLYRLAYRFLTPPLAPPAPPPPAPPPPARPRDSLTNDPKLMAFFKRVDSQFHAPPSPIVPTPVQPIVTHQVADPDLAAVIQIWTQLSPRDRRELRRLAEMKRDSG